MGFKLREVDKWRDCFWLWKDVGRIHGGFCGMLTVHVTYSERF